MGKNGPFQEQLNVVAQETTINTTAEYEIVTPVSKSEAIAMLIHQLRFELAPPTLIDTLTVDTHVQLRRRSSTTGALARSDPSVIATYAVFASVNKVAGAAEKAIAYTEEGSKLINYDPPLLIAASRLYLAVKSYVETAVRYGHCQIGYTLEKVSKEDFIAALVSHQV